MKLEFFYGKYGLLDVKTDPDTWVLGYYLTDENDIEGIDETLAEIESVRSNNGFWKMSYNKTYLEISPTSIRCGDLYNEKDYIDIKPDDFKKVLIEWRKFIKNRHKRVHTVAI